MASDNLFDTRNNQDLISKSHYSSEDSNTLFLLSDSGIGTSPSVNAQQSEDEIDNLIAFTQGDTSPLLCFDSLSDTGASPKYLPDEKEERSTISTKEAPYYHSEGKLTHSKKVSKYAQKSALKKPETTSDELIAIQDSAYQEREDEELVEYEDTPKRSVKLGKSLNITKRKQLSNSGMKKGLINDNEEDEELDLGPTQGYHKL